MTAKIALAHGRGVALVDDEDYERINALKWYIAITQNVRYAKTDITDASGNRRTILMHQLVHGPSTPSRHIDHIDGNGLNNTRTNLRYLPNSINIQRAPSSRAASGYKGVYREPRNAKARPWSAKISINGRDIWLGSFATPEEASHCYQSARTSRLTQFLAEA